MVLYSFCEYFIRKESFSPTKGRTELSALNDRTYGTIREERAPSMHKLQSEGDEREPVRSCFIWAVIS